MYEVAVVVGVKFCGNCNPEIDSSALLARLKEEAGERVVFTGYSCEQKDMLLVLSGCPVDCAERPDFSGPVITVAGDTVQLKKCPEEDLRRVVLEYILKHQNQV